MLLFPPWPTSTLDGSWHTGAFVPLRPKRPSQRFFGFFLLPNPTILLTPRMSCPSLKDLKDFVVAHEGASLVAPACPSDRIASGAELSLDLDTDWRSRHLTPGGLGYARLLPSPAIAPLPRYRPAPPITTAYTTNSVTPVSCDAARAVDALS
jgi:hypothetical protein